MKDLTIKNFDGSIVGTIRAEMMISNPSNFEPLELRDSQGRICDSFPIGDKPFVKINYDWIEFIEHCKSFGLGVSIAETNGNDPIEIVAPVLLEVPTLTVYASNNTNTDITIKVGNRPEILLPANNNDGYEVVIGEGEDVVISYNNELAGTLQRIYDRHQTQDLFESGENLNLSEVLEGEQWVFTYQYFAKLVHNSTGIPIVLTQLEDQTNELPIEDVDQELYFIKGVPVSISWDVETWGGGFAYELGTDGNYQSYFDFANGATINVDWDTFDTLLIENQY